MTLRELVDGLVDRIEGMSRGQRVAAIEATLEIVAAQARIEQLQKCGDIVKRVADKITGMG